MFRKKVVAFLGIAALLQHVEVEASTTATAHVTYTVGSIDAISVSGDPGPLNVTTATAGSAPTSATDATTTYAVTTNNTRSIVGVLTSAMPTGVTLSANLVAPSGGTSAGAVSLSTTSASLVTGISTLSASGLTVTYTLAATVSATQVAGATNTVTYTIQ